MGTKAKNEVTQGSKAIIDKCKQLVEDSKMPMSKFLKLTDMSKTYWYKRFRYEAPLTTTDVEHIANTLGIDQMDIYKAASTAEADTDAIAVAEMVRQASDPESYGLAANRDENKESEALGDAGPDWSELA